MQNSMPQTQGCVQDMPETQSEAQLTQLQRAAQETCKLVDQLEIRLQRVLRERAENKPLGAIQTGQPKEYLVAHADGLRSVREGLESQADSLRSIIERLEA
jgi:hypothetical protein